MRDTTREELQARIAMMRRHLLAIEQALAIDSLADVLICIADLVDEAGKAGDLAKADIEEDHPSNA